MFYLIPHGGGDESLLSSTVVMTNNQIDETVIIKKLELNGDWSGDAWFYINIRRW